MLSMTPKAANAKRNFYREPMIVTPAEMIAIETAAFARGVSAEDLMEEAGRGMADVVSQFFPIPGRALLACGKGNNAGDVLVAGRVLAGRGWTVDLDLAFPEEDLGVLPAKKLKEFSRLDARRYPVTAGGRLVCLDGLLGLGATGEPREPVAAAIHRVNAHRMRDYAFVFSADVPSGLDAHSGKNSAVCVQADCTVTIGFVKSGLLADAATNHVGRLALVPLEALQFQDGDEAVLSSPSMLRHLQPPRNFDSHKGIWGRVGVVAGSPDFPGAACLCSHAAVAAGAGLVTLFALPDTAGILRSRCIPEVMVREVDHLESILDERLDAIAIGPGLGDRNDPAVLRILGKATCPLVVDADALNAAARNSGSLKNAPTPRLLTPHPGEMERLVPGSIRRDRREVAEEFAAAHPGVTLLLKGARTVIAEAGEPTRFNPTGNPGMGSGGMGDTLTGVCAALLARGLRPIDAATVGGWVCGRAAEHAVFCENGSPESLTASDVIRSLGAGFRAISGVSSY